jgi:IS605 OrfB family transposase
VSRDAAGRWHISILVEDAIEPLPQTSQTVGIDAGVTSLVTLSTGEKVTNPKHEQRDRVRLAKAQRNLARKEKGSANRAKARIKVARVHARIADRRRDHLHKLSTRIIRENQTVVIEDLSVRNMVRNHSLARAISDAAWSELRRQLEYKADWYGRTVIAIDRFYPSSKTCSACGSIVSSLPLNVREWTCPCGAHHDRDVNAARNILAAGLAVSAFGDGVRPTPAPSAGGQQSMKKEPVGREARDGQSDTPALSDVEAASKAIKDWVQANPADFEPVALPRGFKRPPERITVSYLPAVRADTSRYPTDPDLADLLAARRSVARLEDEEETDGEG